MEAARKERLKNNVVEPSVSRSPVLEAITKYPKRITLAAGAFLSVQVNFYILISFILRTGAILLEGE
ncbi:MAG: hypothetical protein Ct9H90mP25_2920 [Gammaproteobacteria bacterium]|nr:MAG: hypothetical protein Ct9H90mP25_2920 [Gammaproteobacteria bacterium]